MISWDVLFQFAAHAHEDSTEQTGGEEDGEEDGFHEWDQLDAG
jgi:hypothetical protein